MSLAAQESGPTFIYRQGPDRAKSLSLHRAQDWAAGLSFTVAPLVGAFVTFSASVLSAAGYIVRPDGGELVRTLWDDEPVIDARTGEQATFPGGHVTVYHSDRRYWDQWYQADLSNKGTPVVSPQLQALYALRER